MASTTNQTRTTCGRWAGRWAAHLAMALAVAPSSPWEEAPPGGVARVVVHVVVSPGVGQLQGGPPGDGREGGFA